MGFLPRPHGLHGALEFRPYSGSLDAVEPGRVVRLTSPAGAVLEPEVTAVRPFKKGALITLHGISDRKAADAWRAATVEVWRDDLGPLDADEVYLADLIGLSCILPDGAVAGTVCDVADTGPVPTLIVEGALAGALPWHDDWVGDPDWTAGTLPIRRRPIT